MFFDFSSALNLFQTFLLFKKLQQMQVDASTSDWIIDNLTEHNSWN